MTTAEIILEQLGGNRFVVTTGSHHFVSDGDTLRMQLRRNRSGANRLFITLDRGTDTYTMRFFYYRAGRIDIKNGRFIEAVEREIKRYTEIYAEDLCRIFEDVTGLATHL